MATPNEVRRRRRHRHRPRITQEKKRPNFSVWFLIFSNEQKQIDKGKELLEDLQGEATPASGSIQDLASSLENQLSKFGHRLDDTRLRLDDTTRCYELLDKVPFPFLFLSFFLSFFQLPKGLLYYYYYYYYYYGRLANFLEGSSTRFLV